MKTKPLEFASKKALREALNKANIAYSILESKYNDRQKQYEESIAYISQLEKELYCLRDMHFKPLIEKVNEILASKKEQPLFTIPKEGKDERA